ncbi:MAG: hypothetical protein H0A76_05545 [Candidatus Thiodubiliella endoseptemdiera]|uniref:Uncharacterized protein n=1 Tax=Candidatus Thiodubiliella endoseptemdiera TaxID=2738886 RepID=A0A853F158_9GAMM|nr:hypothetical protein [Candidatus Thiodubiliella endoseptemdiera]
MASGVITDTSVMTLQVLIIPRGKNLGIALIFISAPIDADTITGSEMRYYKWRSGNDTINGGQATIL